MTQQQMQATGRAPRGWDQLVNQLHAAANLREFYRGMLDLQCKVVAAEYGALWIPGQDGEVKAVAAWPDKLVQNPPDHPIIKMLAQAAAGGIQRNTSQVLKIENDGSTGGEQPGLGAHVFVTLMRDSGGKIAAVATVVADCRDPQVIQTTAPLRELAAGLYGGFEARQDAETFRKDAEQVRKSMALLAISQEAQGFKGAALNLVNELARQLKCTRVSIGWVRGKQIKLVSMSDTEHLKRHSELVAHIELAMGECLDQEHPIVYPIPQDAEPLLQHSVLHAHRRVTNEHPNHHILSIPMRENDDWVGVLTLERSDLPFDVDTIHQLQLVTDVLAPHLADRRATSRWLGAHAWNSVTKTAGYLVGPKHVGWKLLGLGCFALLMFAVFGSWDYRVSSQFTIVADGARIVPSPFEGDLEDVFVEPGDHVKAGQTLAQLKAIELKLQHIEASNQYKVAELDHARAVADAVTDPSKTADALQAKAKMLQIKAKIDLLAYQIDQATIKSPIDGVVLSGAWRDKVGGVLKQGEQMFEVAALDDLIAKVRIEEADIDDVREAIDKQAEPLAGYLSTRSEPEVEFGFTVERVVPMAAPVAGQNVFEVRCVLSEPADWLRPGMEGIARMNVGSRRIYWIATHRIVDTVRLWTWWPW